MTTPLDHAPHEERIRAAAQDMQTHRAALAASQLAWWNELCAAVRAGVSQDAAMRWSNLDPAVIQLSVGFQRWW